MATPLKPIGFRVSERDLAILDAVAEHLAERTPGWEPTRGDALRHIIASSGHAAGLPAGTVPPDREKPMRSR